VPYFVCDAIGTGEDAEGNQRRPVVDLYTDTWTVIADGNDRMLVRCVHQPEFDTDVRIRPARRTLLAGLSPDDGEADDSPELAKKIARRFLVRQWLGADDFTAGTLDLTLGDIPLARRRRIRDRLLNRGINIDGLTLSTTIGDALRFIMPQFPVRLEPKAMSPGGTFTDNFTEAGTNVDLAAHTPSGGTAWTRQSGTANTCECEAPANLVKNASDSNGALYQCDDQGSADQYVQFAVVATNQASFVCNRASSNLAYIGVRVNGAPSKVQIFKRVAGVYTQLGSNGATTAVAGNTVRLESSGDAHEAFLNSVSQVGPTNDTHNNTITRQGVNGRSADSGSWIDTFEAGILGGEEPPPEEETPVVRRVGGAFNDGESWREYVEAEYRRRHLRTELVKQEKQLKTVVKQIKTAEKKVKQERTEGILANLQRLEFKKDEIQHKIEAYRQELIPLEWFLEAEIEEDDEEVMLLDS
jgi:hypothetical protein